MSKVRVCFLGTPEFAATSLRALLDDDHFEVVGVVSQPDRPAGRKLQLTPSPVKSLAVAKGIQVLTPESLKNNRLMFDEIRRWGAEVGVVVAFGQILTQEFLDSFHFGCVNVHASLLPRWRGAAPIQRAIEAGDRETGVCLQRIVKKLDAGDVFGARSMPIPPEMNALELHDRLASLGADLLRVELMDYVRGNLAPQPQDENLVTYAKKIEKTESELDWRQPAEVLHNKIRALQMGPGTYTFLQGQRLKISKTCVVKREGTGTPGRVQLAENSSLHVECGEGILSLLEVQPESRNRVPVTDFLKSSPVPVGTVLGATRG